MTRTETPKDCKHEVTAQEIPGDEYCALCGVTLAAPQAARTRGRPSVDGKPGQTPQRQIRLPDATYYPAVSKAKGQGLDFAKVTRRLLDGWLAGDIELPAEDNGARDGRR